nr:capsular polysaccharide synthesis protein [Bacteroidaceae bacterium]
MKLFFPYLNNPSQMMSKIKLLYRNNIEFGLFFLLKEFWARFLLSISKSDANYEYRHKIILSYLYKDNKTFFDMIKSEDIQCEDKPIKKIWFFWWQGFDSIPEICKLCLNSIKHYKSDCQLILLSKDNYKQYSSIPQHIIKKVNDGHILIAHLADMLRCDLLYNHGGLWIDSTLLVTQPLPNDIFNYSFYSVKSKQLDNTSISRYQWGTFIMYSKKGNTFMKNVRDLLYNFFSRYSVPIDYLLIDYYMYLLIQNNSEYKRMIDVIPFSN